MKKRTVLYARVSRDDLHCENQELILKKWAERNEIIDYDYLKEDMTTRKTRPIKQRLMQDFRTGKYDTIVVTRLDRFARSLQELISDVEYIVSNSGRFVSIQNSFDFTKSSYNASQQLMLNIFAAFAQFEREIIRERTIEGLERARAKGVRLGRPSKKGRSKTGGDLSREDTT